MTDFQKLCIVVGLGGLFYFWGTPHVLTTYTCGARDREGCLRFIRCNYIGAFGWRTTWPAADDDASGCPIVKLIPFQTVTEN